MMSLGRLKGILERRLSPRARRLRRYTASRRFLSAAPYPLKIYADAIAAYRDSGIPISPFARFDPAQCAVYLRHDIDLVSCPAMLPRLLEIEKELGVRSASYFQANDQMPYDLRANRDIISDMIKDGFDVGLHTLCYVANDPFEELANECRRFEDAIGISPRSVNAHGLGRYKIDRRLDFYKKFDRNKLNEFGFEFSDISTYLRKYDHVSEDCHTGVSQNAEGIERFMMSDFLDPPPKVPGLHYLILTHPGYWR